MGIGMPISQARMPFIYEPLANVTHRQRAGAAPVPQPPPDGGRGARSSS